MLDMQTRGHLGGETITIKHQRCSPKSCSSSSVQQRLQRESAPIDSHVKLLNFSLHNNRKGGEFLPNSPVQVYQGLKCVLLGRVTSLTDTVSQLTVPELDLWSMLLLSGAF